MMKLGSNKFQYSALNTPDSNVRLSPQRIAPRFRLLFYLSCLFVLFVEATAQAEPPSTAYIFPAGGQRGTKVAVKVGGHYLHDKCRFEMLGPGVTAPDEIRRTETIWFEGPLIHQPASQQKEDYPQDFAGEVTIAADAPLGDRYCRVWNAQGAVPARRFVVGEWPEVVEQESDGQPLPVPVTLPVTINGRIFPREDVDVWEFQARAGQAITCSVAAGAIGSPLEARIEIRNAVGRTLVEASDGTGGDPMLHFMAPADGTYQLRIHDVRFDGLQHFIYRVTIADRRAADSASLATDKEKLPEQQEAEPNDTAAQAGAITAPAVAIGHIDRPGDRDVWSFAAKKGEPLSLDVQAARLGSPLSPVVVVRDSAGKELARADALASGGNDPQLAFNAPADGTYFVEVGERFASRGGAAFVYRLRLAPPQPKLRLELASDAVSVDRGKDQKLAVNVIREGGFNTPVTLAAEGLPEGVTAAEVVVAANQNKGEMVFKADAAAHIAAARVRIVGKTELNGQPHSQVAVMPQRAGELPLDSVLLAVTLPTPFKFQGEYAMNFLPCGSVIRKRFTLERGGYDGPLEVTLADKQARHLQGVTGPVLAVPAGATDFVYPMTLPPWMELGRTCRVVLMATGEVDDSHGGKHKICFTTGDQNNQMVNLISPPPLKVILDRKTLTVSQDGNVELTVHLKRDRAVTSAVRIELIVPRHIRDLRAAPIELSSEQNDGVLTIAAGPQPGPFNLPLLIRATARRGDDPIVAETSLELVPGP